MVGWLCTVAILAHLRQDNNATASSSAFHNDVMLTGSVSDASGLLYMNARYYNPQTARFLSQDTYKGVASSPWTQHLYSYCNNNPVNMIDPTGHKALPCLKDFWEWLTGGGNCGEKKPSKLRHRKL